MQKINPTSFRYHPPISRSLQKNFQTTLYGVLRPAHIRLREQLRTKERGLRFGTYSHIEVMDLFQIIRPAMLLEVITIFTSRISHVWRNWVYHIGHHHLHGKLSLLFLQKYNTEDPANYITRPRFFPFGDGPVNEEGVAHYDDMIASMIEYGLKPAVTLFHWGQFFHISDQEALSHNDTLPRAFGRIKKSNFSLSQSF